MVAPSWQQRQEALCHPFDHTDPDTLWTHPLNWIKPFIFTFSTFFKHPLSHPMTCTQWKHHWLHAVVAFHCQRNHKSCDHSSEGYKPIMMVWTHLISRDVIIIRIVMIRRFDCGSGGSFFNLRALCSTWWCVQQDVEYTTAPRAVSLMYECAWLVSHPDEQVVPSEVGSEAWR